MKKEDALTRSRKRKATAALQGGRLAEAQAICEQLVNARRSDPEALVLLATIHRTSGRYAEAERRCREALRLDPRSAQAHHVLGMARQCQGAMGDALECYRTALSLDPGRRDSHYLLGNALRESEQLPEAITHYRAALKLDPDHVPSLANLGGTLQALNESEQAYPVLEKALQLQPDAAQVLTQMARLQASRERYAEAEAYYRRAMAAAPHEIDTIACFAELLEKSSRLEEAQALVKQGLAIAPDDPHLGLCAAKLARREKRYPDAIALAEAALNGNPSALFRSEIHLLLGQLYDHENEPGRAFVHFAEGNRLLEAADTGVDRSAYPEHLERLRQRFRATLPELADRHPAALEPGTTTPVFLVGFPRSGTTLLEQILDSHPQLQALAEKPTVAAMTHAYEGIVARRPQAASALTEAEIQTLRRRYFSEADRHVKREPGHTLLDKMPLNLANAFLIQRVFPQAKFILALRHPCDACLSCFMQSFVHNDAMVTFVRLEATAAVYASVMSLWQEYAEGLELRYHRLRYEDLVENMEEEARRLIRFLDIEWNPAVLDHAAHAKGRGTIKTPSYHQVTQPIYKKAKYRWKRYSREMEPVLETLRPFIERFGYTE